MRKITAIAAIWAVLGLPVFAQAQTEGSVPAVDDPRDYPVGGDAEYLGITSAVSFLDSAMPRSTIRTRFDWERNDRQPTRAEYLYSGGSFPPGTPRVDQSELDFYVEYATSPWFSLFVNAPYRWVNPEGASRASGTGDLGFGFKLAVWDSDSFLAAIQVRSEAPIASSIGVDNRHWSIEPSFLFDARLVPGFGIEGQFGCWMPLTDAPLAGDVAKYGLGAYLGCRNDCGFWMTPVVEAIGWTCLGGGTQMVDDTGVSVRGARGTTILNGTAGLRMGLGRQFEVYGGYEHVLTGPAWFHEQIRLEMRLFF